MKDLGANGMRPMADRIKGCRHCMTSRGIKKMKDTISRVRNHFSNLWSRRNKK
ncbi:MAG: hypothetical protein NTZ68_00030 [Candidatus Dependentiae bacterium]|nr:hypothetical protein [Candidatus Dependentiae bacterium]